MAMFTTKCRERTTGRCDIPDVDRGTLSPLLKFMYGTLQESAVDGLETARKLLLAAHKYDLPDLFPVCAKILCRFMDLDNAAELLILADRHEVKALKDHALGFIGKHHRDFLRAGHLEVLRKESQSLVDEMILTSRIGKKWHLNRAFIMAQGRITLEVSATESDESVEKTGILPLEAP